MTSMSSYDSIKTWKKQLPFSKMVFPATVKNRVKYGFWRMYTPLHPYVRDFALFAGVVSHSGRQDFLIGMLASHVSFEEIVSFLVEKGYGNHFIAWKDDEELVSLRRVDGFEYQYHLRIFSDGEIRGHYEYTPECYPLLHYFEVNASSCREEFLELLGDKIIPGKLS